MLSTLIKFQITNLKWLITHNEDHVVYRASIIPRAVTVKVERCEIGRIGIAILPSS